MKAAICLMAVTLGFTGGVRLAADTGDQQPNRYGGAEETQLRQRIGEKQPDKKEEKAHSKTEVGSRAADERFATIGETPTNRIRGKVKRGAAAPQRDLREITGIEREHRPSMVGGNQLGLISRNPPIHGAVAEHPVARPIKAPAFKVVELASRFVPSRAAVTASIGGLTSASKRTSAAAINGTGAKYRP